jgi:hypothetical protein
MRETAKFSLKRTIAHLREEFFLRNDCCWYASSQKFLCAILHIPFTCPLVRLDRCIARPQTEIGEPCWHPY